MSHGFSDFCDLVTSTVALPLDNDAVFNISIKKKEVGITQIHCGTSSFLYLVFLFRLPKINVKNTKIGDKCGYLALDRSISL